MDFGSLSISRVIIHEVPKHLRNDTGISPTFSDIDSPLDEQLRLFFREKIIATAGSPSAYCVVFDEKSTSPLPPLVKGFLAGNPQDFVELSKTAALHLHNTQCGVNPGGLITVVDCRLGGGAALAILKLEKEEGVRLTQAQHEGKRTFDVNYIRDLILTKKTKLFKIGLFWPDETGQPEGRVCDEQRGYMPSTEVANFFLTTFLGCRLSEDPRVATRRFFVAAQAFFNESLDDPVERTEAVNHLLSELTSQKSRINIQDFARDYLPVAKRQAFVNRIRADGTVGSTFKKDLSLIEGQTKKIAIEFQSGIAVVGNRDAIGENVKVEKMKGGAARVEITGRLKRVRSK